MLRTNLSASGRELYNNADLNNLVILPYIARTDGRTPYGMIKTTMTFRFAGRVNPDAPTSLTRLPMPLPPVVKEVATV
jgi:hypothetical protein